MSANGAIFSLASKLNGQQIRYLADDVLRELSEVFKGSEENIEDSALYEKLDLLTTLLDHKTEDPRKTSYNKSIHHSDSQDLSNSDLQCVWSGVLRKFLSKVNDWNSHYSIRFLVSAMCHLPDREAKLCCESMQTAISSSIKSFTENVAKSISTSLTQSLNLVEAFLMPAASDETISEPQRSMFLFLSDTIFQADDTLVESTYFLRIAGLLCTGLEKFKSDLFVRTIYKATASAFSSKAEVILSNVQEDCSIPVQHCLILLNLLLDLLRTQDVFAKDEEIGVTSPLHLSASWLIIQRGLKSPKPFVRKQGLYNLRKGLSFVTDAPTSVSAKLESKCDAIGCKSAAPIFLWDLEMKVILDLFWRDFLLVAETLEENQLHVISPVLKKLHGLISITSANKNHINTSWVCVLLGRMITHESKAITREGIILSLQLDQDTFPFLDHEIGFSFLHNGFKEGLIPALQDVNLFCNRRDNGTSNSESAESPIVALHLQDFLNKCASGYSNPAKLLCFLLDSAVKVNWAAVPLFYFCNALSVLPTFAAWSTQELKNFQSLVARCSRTHDIRLRYAIQNLLLRCMIKFTNCSQVGLNEVLLIIDLCNSKEFFRNFRSVWNEISLWFHQNFKLFMDISDEDGKDVWVFTFKKLEKYCTTSSQQMGDFSVDEISKNSKIYALLVLMVEQGMSANVGKKHDDFLKHVCLWLSDITEKASTHLYMPKQKAYKAVAILDHLVMAWSGLASGSDKKNVSLNNTLYKILKNLLSYVLLRFSTNAGKAEEAKFCLDAWRNLFSFLTTENSSCNWLNQLVVEFSPLVSVSLNVFSSFQKKDGVKGDRSASAALTSVFCLSWVCHLVQDFSINLHHNSLVYLAEFLSALDLSGEVVFDNQKGDRNCGREVEWYNSLMWSCVPFAIRMQKGQKSKASLDPVQGMKHLIDRIETVTEKNIPKYMRALGAMIPEALKSSNKDIEEQICECIDISWKIIESLAHSPSFWKSYQSFISAVLQPATLSLSESAHIQEKLSDLLQRIALLSASKPGLIEFACKVCLNTWIECPENLKSHLSEPSGLVSLYHECTVKSESAKIHSSFIVQCLTFSVLCKKEDIALSNVLKLVERDNANDSGFVNRSPEHLATSVIAMLLQLSPESKGDRLFCSAIVHELLKLDDAMTKKKSRYHHNSLQHHVKNKIYQAVLLLLPYISGNKAGSMVDYIIFALKKDAQPSVRYFMEWTLSLIIHRFDGFEEVLLKQLTDFDAGNTLTGSGAGGAKFSAICSFLTVALFIGLDKDGDLQQTYFSNLINVCLPWCMTQHFSIRLYALAVVLRIKIYFENIGRLNHLVERQPSLPACLLFADHATGNVARNWSKMKDNFFIFDFHPIEDLSLETVFVSIPRLCGLQDHATMKDISAAIGHMPEAKNFIFRSGAQLFNGRDVLRSKTGTNWIPQESKQSVDNFANQDMRYRKNYGAEELTDDFTNLFDGKDNVQKKIMPWLEMADIESEESLSKKRPKGLILVASLIDKPSNLGGLTRTCEIFGAEVLVVQSLSCINDKLFQSLSVTAHKWLPMREVKPWQLEEYLQSMRNEGYTLVGTEQTAQSVCLSKYKFPRKCVVVLGNEKEGIPISILKILDVCVQIPQKGIIRSLNVHVSGAITVWEYARQHISDE